MCLWSSIYLSRDRKAVKHGDYLHSPASWMANMAAKPVVTASSCLMPACLEVGLGGIINFNINIQYFKY